MMPTTPAGDEAMKKLVATTLILLCAALAEPAGAVVIEAPPGRPYQAWADKARVPTPPGVVEIVETHCPIRDLKDACTWPTGPIFLVPRRLGPWVKMDFLHELGHQVDYRMSTDKFRGRFLRLIEHPGPWVDPPSSPSEQFAEAWAICALAGTRSRKRFRRFTLGEPIGYGYGYVLTWRFHRRVCKLISTLNP